MGACVPPALKATYAEIEQLKLKVRTLGEWQGQLKLSIKKIPGFKDTNADWGTWCAAIERLIGDNRDKATTITRLNGLLDWTGHLLGSEQTTDQEWADLYDALKHKDDPYVIERPKLP